MLPYVSRMESRIITRIFLSMHIVFSEMKHGKFQRLALNFSILYAIDSILEWIKLQRGWIHAIKLLQAASFIIFLHNATGFYHLLMTLDNFCLIASWTCRTPNLSENPKRNSEVQIAPQLIYTNLMLPDVVCWRKTLKKRNYPTGQQSELVDSVIYTVFV